MTQQLQITGYRFDDIHLDIQNRRLWRGDELLALNSKYFDALALLVSHSGQLVEKRTLFDTVWDGVFVSDAALTQCVKEIRRHLQDDASNPRYVKTVPKHGYVFMGEPVEIYEDTPAPLRPSGRSGVFSRPYKFLDYYTEQDAALFFGRESEVEAICSQILAHRSFLLYGRSGVGKSSLIRAGLLPELQSQGHFTFIIRSFTDPVAQISAQLTRILYEVSPSEENDFPESSLDLMRRIHTHAGDSSMVVFFDQFEEFFTLLDQNLQNRLVDEITTLTSDTLIPARFVFALREDLIAEMTCFKTALPEIFHHEYRLNRLTREQAIRAITEPARAVGCALESTLVERLLNDLSEQSDIDPPHLQIVCDTLYDARDTQNRITEEIYERLGGAARILTEYLTRVLRRFRADDLTTVQHILLALISTDKQRLVLRESDLKNRIQSEKISSSISRLLEELVEARVIRRRSQDGEGWIELAHECLIPEVSQWLTRQVFEVKQARGLLERAMQNYRAHQLILDQDSLNLLSPYLDKVGVTEEEADLLTRSLLHRGRPVPEWLIRNAPSALNIVLEAARHPDATVRLCAISSSRPVRDPQLNTCLRTMALWDNNLEVRKSASIELADWFGAAVESIFTRVTDNERVGGIRRAISLAIVREHNNRLIQLPHLSIALSVMVMMGLILFRFRQSSINIIRQGVGGTFGGAASGLAGGFILGIGLSIARQMPLSEIPSLVFVLSSLGVFVGAFGGAGVSFGMVASRQIAYRRSPWWTLFGGALGGALIGGCANLFSVDVLKTLFGRHPTGLTGGLEGAVIGIGVAMGPVLTDRFFAHTHSWNRILNILMGAAGGMLAGLLLTIIGGNLFSSSLEIIRASFADSQIRIEPIAQFFGEGYFGRTTKLALGALEGFLFGGCVIAGIEMFRSSRET